MCVKFLFVCLGLFVWFFFLKNHPWIDSYFKRTTLGNQRVLSERELTRKRKWDITSSYMSSNSYFSNTNLKNEIKIAMMNTNL